MKNQFRRITLLHKGNQVRKITDFHQFIAQGKKDTLQVLSKLYTSMNQQGITFLVSTCSLHAPKYSKNPQNRNLVGSTEAPSKAFLLFFLFSDWLKSNHLRSWIERGFLDIFSRHICSAVTETIRVTNYATSFGATKCSENRVWSCWNDFWSVEPTKPLF